MLYMKFENKPWIIDLSSLGYENETVTIESHFNKIEVKDGIKSKCSIKEWDEDDNLYLIILFLRDIYYNLVKNKISFS